MSRISADDVRRIAAITEQLETLRIGKASVVPALLGDVAALLRSEHVVTYATTPGLTELVLDFAYFTPAARGFEACFRAASPLPGRYGLFNPNRPEPGQRNAPFNLEQLTRKMGPPTPLFESLSRFDIPNDDQLRVLLCDGPSLLALLSVVRDRPFDTREQALFAKLVPALQRRFKLERDLASATLHRAAMEAALESVSAPAFVVLAGLRIAHANAAGRILFEGDHDALIDDLRASIAKDTPRARFTVTRLCSSGEPRAWLAVERCVDTAAARAKARSVLAAQRYSLTARQREVLELLVQGMANKSIAAALGCAVSTVEIHVTAILDRAGVSSRAALVAKFWTES